MEDISSILDVNLGEFTITSRPALRAISHRRAKFTLVLRPEGQPIPSTVHNPKRVDLVVGCSVLYCAARPVIRALPTVLSRLLDTFARISNDYLI